MSGIYKATTKVTTKGASSLADMPGIWVQGDNQGDNQGRLEPAGLPGTHVQGDSQGQRSIQQGGRTSKASTEPTLHSCRRFTFVLPDGECHRTNRLSSRPHFRCLLTVCACARGFPGQDCSTRHGQQPNSTQRLQLQSYSYLRTSSLLSVYTLRVTTRAGDSAAASTASSPSGAGRTARFVDLSCSDSADRSSRRLRPRVCTPSALPALGSWSPRIALCTSCLSFSLALGPRLAGPGEVTSALMLN